MSIRLGAPLRARLGAALLGSVLCVSTALGASSGIEAEDPPISDESLAELLGIGDDEPILTPVGTFFEDSRVMMQAGFGALARSRALRARRPLLPITGDPAVRAVSIRRLETWVTAIDQMIEQVEADQEAASNLTERLVDLRTEDLTEDEVLLLARLELGILKSWQVLDQEKGNLETAQRKGIEAIAQSPSNRNLAR